MYQFIASVVEGLAIILGPIFGATIEFGAYNIELFERYITFLLSFLCWISFERLFFLYLSSGDQFNKKEKPLSKKQSISFVLSLIISGFIAIGILHLLQAKTERFFFHTTLIALSMHLIATIALQKELLLLRLSARFFYNALLGALGFMILTQKANWQPFVISSGFALMVAAMHLSSLCLPDKKEKLAEFLKKDDFAILKKIYALCLFGGPMLISFLCITRQLPKNYIFLLLVLFPAKHLPARFGENLRMGHNKKTLIVEYLQKFVIMHGALILGMLLIVALLTTFS